MGLRRYLRRFRAVISLDNSPYLTRYRLIVTRSRCIYLHHILRSDADRNMHDHPFDFTVVVLWGGYWEHAPKGVTWRGPGSIIRHSAEDLHRIEMPKNRTAWTLFIRGPKRRDWGFQTATGWVAWQDYEDVGDMTGRSAVKEGAHGN